MVSLISNVPVKRGNKNGGCSYGMSCGLPRHFSLNAGFFVIPVLTCSRIGRKNRYGPNCKAPAHVFQRIRIIMLI
jgi:hypothetical protein